MDFVGAFSSITFLGVFKLMIVVLLTVYTIFALLMMKQIGAMTKAVEMKDDYIIRILGILNFVFAILVLIVSLVIL